MHKKYEERPSTSGISQRKETLRSRSNSKEDNIVQIGNCDINGSNDLIQQWGEGFIIHRCEDEGLGSFTGERRRRKLPEIPTTKKCK